MKQVMKSILALDPGPEQTAFFRICGIYWSWDIRSNEDILSLLDFKAIGFIVACEEIASFGMPVGAETFETVRWEGEFRHACRLTGIEFRPVKRLQIKMHHCKSARASDSNIRQALVDRFGKHGTKKNPGRIYGIHGKDIWSAFAIAVWMQDQLSAKEEEDGFLAGVHNHAFPTIKQAQAILGTPVNPDVLKEQIKSAGAPR